MLAAAAGCSSEGDRVMKACEEEIPGYMDQMADYAEEWKDAYKIATATSRIALSGPVGELQEIRREASKVVPPECVAEEHDSYLEGMDTYIGMILDFMADSEFEADESEIFFASIYIEILPRLVEEYEKDPQGLMNLIRGSAATSTAQAAPPEEREN